MKKLLCLIFLLIISCGPGPDELFETAELEVLQTNYPHATRLYLEIIEKYPDSDVAATAQKRLEEIKKKTENNPVEK